VPYAPGRLEARGYNGGKLAATDVRETTGAPAQILLIPDRTALVADNQDLIPVKVAIADAQGRIVPTADNEVTFQLSPKGRIAGVGNGDPASHEPDKANRRHAFNGLCQVLVQSSFQSGSIRLTAASPGLRPASVEFKAQLPQNSRDLR
jgi:beta-galactosidase